MVSITRKKQEHKLDLAKHLFPQLVSISETFYEQLLLTLVPKVQKGTDDLIVYFTHLVAVHVKVAHKMLMKLTPVRENPC